MRKQQKALTAERACMYLAERAKDHVDNEVCRYWAGRFSAIATYSGFLSTQQIMSEIADAAEAIDGFGEAYAVSSIA